ncbi:MAG: acyl-CoA dehydrogenase [Sandarakinorhabdus sp.]|nr:acyl-CoA dehydrogenase [Sandarakinorhabdus sp.]
MNLSPTADQIAVLDALDRLARPFGSPPLHGCGFAVESEALDRELADGGFLDVAFDPDLGTLTAAMVIERLARLPYATQAMASAMIGPLMGDGIARPLCLVREADLGRPIRFLRDGATLLIVGSRNVRSLVVTAAMVQPVDSLFAWPMAGLSCQPDIDSLTVLDLSAADLLTRWRAGLAAEAAGLLAAALQSTTGYVTDRQQFGRPIASFQAVRHRLAEIQVRANGLGWMALKAAATLDPADAALAALHAQESARIAVYDMHQFMGAMGVTLEHPLHLWTYRLKALIGELGGRAGQGLAAADAIWGPA